MTLTNKDGLGAASRARCAERQCVAVYDRGRRGAMHPYELPRREFNDRVRDYRLHGVGGDTVGER